SAVLAIAPWVKIKIMLINNGCDRFHSQCGTSLDIGCRGLQRSNLASEKVFMSMNSSHRFSVGTELKMGNFREFSGWAVEREARRSNRRGGIWGASGALRQRAEQQNQRWQAGRSPGAHGHRDCDVVRGTRARRLANDPQARLRGRNQRCVRRGAPRRAYAQPLSLRS